jgi:small GTP-binding protein
LVGESGVGKTSIISRFVKGNFNEEEKTTICVSYDTILIKFEEFNTVLEYNLWDTAGQERYRGLTRMFYIDANIVLFVYDITDRKSFDEFKNYWCSEIKKNSPEDTSKNYFLLYNYIYINIIC